MSEACDPKGVFRVCKQEISQVCEGKGTRQVWLLENWSKSWQFLKSHAKCTMKVSNASLRFFLGDHLESPRVKSGRYMEATWLSLLAQRIATGSEKTSTTEEAFKVQVDQLDENLDICSSSIPETFVVFTSATEPVVLKDDFIHLSNSFREDNKAESRVMQASQSTCLRYGITVTPLTYNSNLITQVGEGSQTLATQTSNSIQSSDDWNTIIYITCPDQPYQRFQIRKWGLEQSSFLKKQLVRNSIKVPLESKVMPSILKWLTSGELLPFDEKASLLDIVDAAKLLELSDLLAHLDITMVEHCNHSNKSELLRIARLGGLQKAAEAIANWTHGRIGITRPSKIFNRE